METLDEFYVVQIKTDKTKNHIVPIADGEIIYKWFIDPSRKPHDVIEIRNGAIKFKNIENVFRSYNHKR